MPWSIVVRFSPDILAIYELIKPPVSIFELKPVCRKIGKCGGDANFTKVSTQLSYAGVYFGAVFTRFLSYL
jgi:hypothetical protein